MKIPEQDSSLESSSGLQKTEPKATSSPVVIDLDSGSDKSSRSGRSTRSTRSARTTRNSSKRKADAVPAPKNPKKAKKEEKKKKTVPDKGKQNGSEPAKPKEETLNEFLKKKDLKKWHQVIDMLSSEDLEAIDILITQRRSEEEAALDKEIKEEPEQKPVLKGGKQTDGSCDRTTGTATDATDETDTDTKEEKKHKKRICRKLNREFIVYVGEERTKMCLVECSDSNNVCETSGSASEETGSNSEESDKSEKKSNSEESDKSAQNSNSEESDKSAQNSNSEESDKSAKNSNSEESVEEIEVPPKSIPIYAVDSSSSNSEKTENIYQSYMDGSKLSLATVSTVSTGPYSHSDESVEVLAKPLVTEESTTIPYSQSDESIQLEEKRDEKEKESEESHVTDSREENKKGKNSDKGAVSPVKNY